MVTQSVHGDVEVETEEAVIAKTGELQVGVEDNQHETMDLKRMTRFINLYHLQDTEPVLIIPSRIRRRPTFLLSHQN